MEIGIDPEFFLRSKEHKLLNDCGFEFSNHPVTSFLKKFTELLEASVVLSVK